MHTLGFAFKLDFDAPSAALVLGPHCAQANEFGEAEVWMNERLMRTAPSGFASFVTAFEESPAGSRAAAGRPAPLWLVWRYEGDFTLADLMKARSRKQRRGLLGS